MTVFVALLRAINVTGTGVLPMAELRALCEEAGFSNPTTYIQSGNVVFGSKLSADKTKAKFEKALAAKMGKAHGVMLRTADELDAILKKVPFKKADPKFVVVLFTDDAPTKAEMAAIATPGKEEWKLLGSDLVIHYAGGQGASKLKIPFAKRGTARNLNTITKLRDMAREAE